MHSKIPSKIRRMGAKGFPENMASMLFEGLAKGILVGSRVDPEMRKPYQHVLRKYSDHISYERTVCT